MTPESCDGAVQEAAGAQRSASSLGVEGIQGGSQEEASSLSTPCASVLRPSHTSAIPLCNVQPQGLLGNGHCIRGAAYLFYS